MKIGIVGGGASGVISAINLLRVHGNRAEITIFEPSDELGAGLAYSTNHDSHLLNVPAGRMSCIADLPDDFDQWLRENAFHVFSQEHFPFVCRAYYRLYLQDRLKQTQIANGAKLTWFKSRVESIRKQGKLWELQCPNQRQYSFDHCWIATGYASRKISPFRVEPAVNKFFYFAYEIPKGFQLKDHTTVCIAGAGLSAIDQWRQLRADGFQGRVKFISRRGLLPREQSFAQQVDANIPYFQSPRRLLTSLRLIQKQHGINWSALADNLRSQAQHIWQRWSEIERRQFQRHLKPYWEVIRHRLPKVIHEALRQEVLAGQVQICRARIQVVKMKDDGRKLIVQTAEGKPFDAGILIDATGVQVNDPSKLYSSLISPTLVGPSGKLRYWEVTAIPEIVQQTLKYAQALTSDEVRFQQSLANP